MALYRNLTLVEATQWFKNGDHPEDSIGAREIDWVKVGDLYPELLITNNAISIDDIPKEAYYTRVEGSVVRYFRLPPPGPSGEDIHKVCGYPWHDHGWIDEREDGITVCPGDWVITDKFYGGHVVVKDDVFKITHKVVTDA